MRLSDLPPGSCFKQGKFLKKKLPDGRVVSVNPKGRVRVSTPKADPVVNSTACDLKMLGVGLRRHPEIMVEMGSGKPSSVKVQRLK